MALCNFSWIIPNKLAATAIPGGYIGAEKAKIEADLKELLSYGIKHLVSLELMGENFGTSCNEIGIDWTEFYIKDFDVPRDIYAFDTLVKKIINWMNSNSAVCIHCHAGVGRTGMVVACVVGKYFGVGSISAINTVRQSRKAIDTSEQAMFVSRYLD